MQELITLRHVPGKRKIPGVKFNVCFKIGDSPNFYVKYLYFELHNALMHENEKGKPHVMGSDRIKGFFYALVFART